MFCACSPDCIAARRIDIGRAAHKAAVLKREDQLDWVKIEVEWFLVREEDQLREPIPKSRGSWTLAVSVYWQTASLLANEWLKDHEAGSEP